MGDSRSTLDTVAIAAAELVREHTRSTVLPSLLENKMNLPRSQAISVLKDLAQAGYGEFILGRRGGETRLEKGDALPRREADNVEVQSSSSGTSGSDQQTLLLHRSTPTRVAVPADLTVAEADRIARWLKAIAIDSKD